MLLYGREPRVRYVCSGLARRRRDFRHPLGSASRRVSVACAGLAIAPLANPPPSHATQQVDPVERGECHGSVRLTVRLTPRSPP